MHQRTKNIEDLVVVNCPVFMPKIKGIAVFERPFTDHSVLEQLGQTSIAHTDWLFMILSRMMADLDIRKAITNFPSIPILDTDYITDCVEIGVQVLRWNDDSASVYKLYRLQLFKNYPVQQPTVPTQDTTDAQLQEVVSTLTESIRSLRDTRREDNESTQVVEPKHSKFIACLQVLFATGEICDKTGLVTDVQPGKISDAVLKCIESDTYVANLRKDLAKTFDSRLEDSAELRDFTFWMASMPTITSTAWVYFIQ